MKNFTMVQNDILEANISDGAMRLYMILSSYCYGDKYACFPSQNTLAAKLNKSVRTVQRYLGELIGKRLIIKKRRGSTSNEYQIVEKAISNTSSKKKKNYKRKPSAVEPAAKPRSKEKSFSAYSQRNYNFEKLEDMLLGRNNSLSYEDCLL